MYFLILQIPDCSAGILAGQSGQDVNLKDNKLSYLVYYYFVSKCIIGVCKWVTTANKKAILYSYFSLQHFAFKIFLGDDSRDEAASLTKKIQEFI